MQDSSPTPLPIQPGSKRWNAEKLGLYSALTLLGLQHRADKVLNCGETYARYHCHDCGHDIDLSMSCDNRLCPRCSVRRCLRFILTHQTALELLQEPKLLTLTYKSITTLTPTFISHATKTFAKLRRRKLWRDNVRGGLASLEFTWTQAGWHPHWHILADASYISQKLLSSLWREITKDSYIVYIQAADKHTSLYEVAKYIAKGSKFWQRPHLLAQYMDATHKRRFFLTFGSLHNTAQPIPDPLHHLHPPDRSNLVGDPPPHVPLVTLCPHCGGTHLTWRGFTTPNPIHPPPVQIPF